MNDGSLPGCDLVVIAIDVLSRLTWASLKSTAFLTVCSDDC
jgi:hypothetical protein